MRYLVPQTLAAQTINRRRHAGHRWSKSRRQLNCETVVELLERRGNIGNQKGGNYLTTLRIVDSLRALDL